MKYIEQHDEKDCGIACLAMIAQYYGANYRFQQIRDYAKTDIIGTSLFGMVNAAEKMGFCAEAFRGNIAELITDYQKEDIICPFIAHFKSDHFVVVYRINKVHIYIIDPAVGKIKMKLKDFGDLWSGIFIKLNITEFFTKKKKESSLWRMINHNIKKYKTIIIKIQILSILISLISIIVSYIFQIILDNNIYVDGHIHEFETKNGSDKVVYFLNYLLQFRNIKTYIYILAVMYIIQFTLFVIRNIIIAFYERKFDVEYIQNFFLDIIEEPLNRIKSLTIGDYLSRLQDSDKVKMAISTSLFAIIYDLSFVIISSVILCSVSMRLFLKTIYIFLAYVVLYILFSRSQAIKNREIMLNYSKLVSYYKEIIEGIETIKFSNYTHNIKEKISNKYLEKTNSVLKNNIMISVQKGIFLLIDMFGMLVLMNSGIKLIEINVMTIGQFAMYYIILNLFLEPLKDIVKSQAILESGRIALERLEEIIHNELINKELIFSNGEIVYDNVSFSYGYNKIILENINCVIKKTEKIAIVGKSGSGKSTFAKLLLAQNEITQGKITINGNNIFNISEKSLYSNISYVSQNIILFHDSLKNNVLMGRKLGVDKLEEMIELCGLYELVNSLPDGLESQIGENGYNLSGGQRARIALARALISDPDILVLDEFTSNLDPVTENKINNMIFNLKCTILLVSHRFSQVVKCDKVIYMENGQIIGFGSHNKLLSIDGYNEFWINK